MASDTALTNGSFEEKEYLKYAFHVDNLESEQTRLRRCLANVEGELHTLVSQCHGPLIDDLHSIEQADKSLQSVRSSLVSLEQASQRLHQHIEAPCTDVEANVIRLKNFMKAVETSRSVAKFLSLVGKLKDTLAASDVLRAARYLREVEDVLAESDLRGIHVIEANLSVVTSAASTIRKEASDILRKSISPTSLNVADCGKALQIFYSLEALPKKVAEVLGEQKRNAMHLVLRELEVSTITTLSSSTGATAHHHQDPTSSPSGPGGVPNLSSAKEALFFHIDSALSGVKSYAQSVALLWRVAHRKRDPLTQQLFASVLYPDHSRLLSDFWDTLSENLSTMLKLKGRSDLRTMLAVEYPRFHRLITSFVESQGMIDFLRETQRNQHSTEAQLAALTPSQVAKQWLQAILGDSHKEYSLLTLEELRAKCGPARDKLAAAAESAIKLPQNVMVDYHRHSALPSQVTCLDLKVALKWVAHEVATHRRDYSILAIVLHTTHKALGEFHQMLENKIKRKVPIVEVPSLNTSMNGVGLLHVAIANVAASVSADVGAALSVLPSAIRTGGGHAAGSVVDGPITGADVPSLVRALQAMCSLFGDLSSRLMAPYFDAAGITLGKLAVSAVVDADFKSASAGVSEGLHVFEEKLRFFVCHYALLFDRSTNVDALKHQLAFNLLKKFSVATCCFRGLPFSPEVQGLLVKNYLEFQSMLVPLASVDRQKDSARLVAGVRAMLLSSLGDFLTTAKNDFLGATGPVVTSQTQLHPLLVLFHAFQRVDPTVLVPVHLQMKKQLEPFILETVSPLLMQVGHPSSCAVVWEAASKCLAEFESRPESQLSVVGGGEDLAPITPEQRSQLVALCSAIGDRIIPQI